MPFIHVCSLNDMALTVAEARASHLVTLINTGTAVPRPRSIPTDRHLFLGVSDIVSPINGMVLPAEEHVRELIAFVDGWSREQSMVIHCFAGISRSTAAAFIALCRLAPDAPEKEIARRIRRASPIASPNPRLVEIADDVLDRGGRMIDALISIGPGDGAFVAVPFSIAVGDQ